MKVLVTGHKGYIGAVVAPFLRAAGPEITGLDTDLYEGCDFGEDSLLICGVPGFGLFHGKRHPQNDDFGVSSFIALDLFPRMSLQGLSTNLAPSEAREQTK